MKTQTILKIRFKNHPGEHVEERHRTILYSVEDDVIFFSVRPEAARIARQRFGADMVLDDDGLFFIPADVMASIHTTLDVARAERNIRKLPAFKKFRGKKSRRVPA